MSLKGVKIGVALCGSYCTYDIVFKEIEKLVNMGADITPIMSHNSYITDTRFGKAKDFIDKLKKLSGKDVIHTIKGAEPLGPKNLIDALLIAPCTGNTLAKLAHSITDTPVTMAAKSIMRNQKPVIISLATNDGLGLSLSNIATLLTTKNIYFVPLGQDDYIGKPNSLVANMSQITQTIDMALLNKQIQPILYHYPK